MKNLLVTILLVPILAGCASTPQITLIDGAINVRVAKSDPPLDNYQEVGPVYAAHGKGCGAWGYFGTYEGAMTVLKNRAYEMGADYVQLFRISEPRAIGGCSFNVYELTGTAYRRIK